VPVDGADPEELATFGYEISDRPGARLFVGKAPGLKRPAIWMEMPPEPPVLLGFFQSPKHALLTVNFLDTMVDQINRVIQHLTETKDHDPTNEEGP
jgi:hypothetical protein